ncbi:Clavaminate synthase-like protein [Abortiporus biennis]|nr:Clavaminate synthase-like protein [Abortiporus biennis]
MLRLNTFSRLARSRVAARHYSYSTVTSTPGDSHAVEYNGVSYPFRWLRDSCQCPECVHPSTRQKLHRTSDIPGDVGPKKDGVKAIPSGLQIQWQSGHLSFYPKNLLQAHSTPDNLATFHRDVEPIPWDTEKVTKAPSLFVSFDSLQTKEGLSAAIDQITKYGLLFMTGVPTEKTTNEECAVRTVANTFGQLRPTFYGETWDVKNIRNSTNIAYTNLFLGFHTDLQYFNHPPRYQFLHCLRNKVQGGTSLFVDALAAAETLRKTNPEDFDLLTSTPVKFHYINDGHHLHNSHPTIELATFPKVPGEPRPIRFINYSPPFQAPLPVSTPPEFYTALERFVALLEEESSRYEYTLREGDCVMFDNRRVLHARTAFTDEGDVGVDEVNRWLKGCYIEADSVLDQGRVLRKALEKQ